MDVKTLFLNGDLQEEIYMEQSKGFIVHGQECKVFKLGKSLYGLKQDPKGPFGNVFISCFLFFVSCFTLTVSTFFRTRNRNVLDKCFCFLFLEKQNQRNSNINVCLITVSYFLFLVFLIMSNVKHMSTHI